MAETLAPSLGSEGDTVVAVTVDFDVAGPRVTTTDRVEIATYDLGGDGPPLLLAHATGFHGRVWLPVAATLRDRYHCWSFDSRGHGDSAPAPDGSYAWEGFGRDVLAVVAGLGLEQPGAVGHSCGGAALLLAEEAEPPTFSALYCYEPVVPITEGAPSELPTDNPLAAGARRRRQVFASRAAACDNYAAKPPFTSFDPAALEAYVEWGFHDLADGTVELACARETEARIYEQAWCHRAFQHLDQVSCPATLASGGRQAHFGIEVTAVMAARLVGPATVEVHDQLGHFGPMERPAEIGASIIAAFDAMTGGLANG
jgi:pimeloyl-ACP methyl ester carboxylesterase